MIWRFGSYLLFAANFLLVLTVVLVFFGDIDSYGWDRILSETGIVEELDLLRFQRLALYQPGSFPPPEYHLYPDAQTEMSMLKGNVVPKIVHFIWFRPASKCNFTFHQFISVFSAYTHIKPDHIYFWHNSTPCGAWWEKVKNMTSLVPLPHEAPTSIFGNPVVLPEHQSDFMRLLIMRSVGGIYLDTDVVALRSWDDLLRYSITLGVESSYYLNNGIIISKPDSLFVRLWYDSYRIFSDAHWGFSSLYVPMLIARRHPELVHLEWGSFHEPSWDNLRWLYEPGFLYDFSHSYSVHLWARLHNREYTPEDIGALNTTLGQIFRYIYYGSKDILSNTTTHGSSPRLS